MAHFVAIGAVLTVLTSWCWSVLAPLQTQPFLRGEYAPYLRPQERRDHPDGELLIDLTGGLGFTDVSLIGFGPVRGAPGSYVELESQVPLPGWARYPEKNARPLRVKTHARGFPFRAMVGTTVDPRLLEAWLSAPVRRTGIMSLGAFHLPVRPIPIGFALDTAFYGTLAFLLWSGPGFVRRTRRHRRGLCVGCGYELKGMPKCPECGL